MMAASGMYGGELVTECAVDTLKLATLMRA